MRDCNEVEANFRLLVQEGLTSSANFLYCRVSGALKSMDHHAPETMLDNCSRQAVRNLG
jgi:hypothetical protein